MFLPTPDREYLTAKGIAYEEAEDAGSKGLILRAFAIPGGRLAPTVADVLILLPPGYPDVAPDMFHTNPWLKLVSQGGYAKNADNPVNFQGVAWQRWSRHNPDWRSGIDGIHTMVARVNHALLNASA